MHNYFYVFVGGGLGSICRFGIGQLIAPWRSTFPWATFFANVLACLVLGVLATLSARGKLGSSASIFFMAGFCGGFSTFSTFTNETVLLLANGLWWKAAANLLGNLVACFAALYVGGLLVRGA